MKRLPAALKPRAIPPGLRYDSPCSARRLFSTPDPVDERLERAHYQRRRKVAVAVVRHSALEQHARRARVSYRVGKRRLIHWKRHERIPEVVHAEHGNLEVPLGVYPRPI